METITVKDVNGVAYDGIVKWIAIHTEDGKELRLSFGAFAEALQGQTIEVETKMSKKYPHIVKLNCTELQGRDPGDPLRVEWVDYDWSLNGLVTCH